MEPVERLGGLTLLRVSGSPYEQGFQHGSLLADRVADGPLPYLRNMVRDAMTAARPPWVVAPVLAYLKYSVQRRLARRFPDEMMQLMRGFADGARVPLADVLNSATIPETFVALIALSMRLAPRDRAFACTSAIAGRTATASGRILHARNLDYPATGYWDRNSLVTFHEPANGQRYLSISSIGAPTGGVTGMNEAGLTMAIHQHWVRELDFNGVPVGIAAELALKHAKSIDEAIAVIREYPPVTAWTYLIADGKTGEAAALEVAPGRHGIVRLGETGVPDCLGYSNVFKSPAMEGAEAPFIPSYWDNCLARFGTANRRLAEGRGKLTPVTMAEILGAEEEPVLGAPRLLGGCVPMAITVASVVFDPEEGRVWVSEGAAPTSHGRFVPMSLAARGVDASAEAFTPRGFSSPGRVAAHVKFVEAYRAYTERADYPGALRLVREAARGAPDAPDLAHLHGLLALKAGEAGEAAACFDRALREFHEPVRISEARLALALATDLEPGGREKALALYRSIEDDAGAPTMYRAIARRRRWSPYTKRRARGLAINFIFGGIAD